MKALPLSRLRLPTLGLLTIRARRFATGLGGKCNACGCIQVFVNKEYLRLATLQHVFKPIYEYMRTYMRTCHERMTFHPLQRCIPIQFLSKEREEKEIQTQPSRNGPQRNKIEGFYSLDRKERS